MRIIFILSALICIGAELSAQTSVGILIGPTGTEPGLGIRTSRDCRWAADIRIAKANIFVNPKGGAWVNEASVVCRVLKQEKIRLNVGTGFRADLSIQAGTKSRFGAVIPLGIEAFPFPFPNGGLFFEVAPFATTVKGTDWNLGLRAVSGFIYYIPQNKNGKTKK
jgi:hypothetical protein